MPPAYGDSARRRGRRAVATRGRGWQQLATSGGGGGDITPGPLTRWPHDGGNPVVDVIALGTR